MAGPEPFAAIAAGAGTCGRDERDVRCLSSRRKPADAWLRNLELGHLQGMKDLAGVSSYMLEKSNEERGHASRMIAYLVDSAARLVRR